MGFQGRMKAYHCIGRGFLGDTRNVGDIQREHHGKLAVYAERRQ